MESLGFWDVAPIVYLVGFVLAFVLIHDKMAKPESYRIPFSAFIALWWPLVIGLYLILYIEDKSEKLRTWIINKIEYNEED